MHSRCMFDKALIDRPKRGFGQPIFEWLSPGGHLRPAVEEIADYPFIDKKDMSSIQGQA